MDWHWPSPSDLLLLHSLSLSPFHALSHRLKLEELGAFKLLLRRMLSCSGDGRKA